MLSCQVISRVRPLTPLAQDRDPFVQAAKRTPVDLREWAISLMERDNRKSHLAPQLSPATQDLLRSSDSPTIGLDDRALPTPTSGDIPIAGAGIVSPRDGANRSPTRNGIGSLSLGIGSLSLGRPAGSTVHPGLGQRVITTNSIPKMGQEPKSAGPLSASAASFNLPVRPAPPPGGPLPPPPPPRKETPEELRRENRRQATFGMPPNGAYGIGYPSAN